MNCRLHFAFFLLLVGELFSVTALASATPTPAPFQGNLEQDSDSLLKFKKKSGSDVDTIRLIDRQNQISDSGDRSTISRQESLTIGQARAEQMVNALKGEELQKAFAQMTNAGNRMLEENPELRNPATIVAGAFALWAGNTIKLIKQENFKLFSRIEGRNRSGEFRMESPLLDSKLHFNANEGLQINMNRNIQTLDSAAGFTYNAKTQAVGGEVSHHLMEHVDLSVGTSQSTQTKQTDEQAKIQYHLNF